MATLVLSTVGAVLGGPVGGAIGSLIGQSIDQQLLGPGPRQGPRLGDLSVQTSSYGSPIPRLYGSMRVAGTIVWSTDLQEDSQTTGAKGQPDTTTYSYSVSFAVALSSRKISRIGRIWADGNLIRGADGTFNVSTEFRFYPGDEDQPADPLIASIEGVGLAPAYRGAALAVFENLQLAEFGNRIPFLTFEVLADPAPPEIAAILDDCSAGAIEASASETVIGYAAYGGDIRSSVEPLVERFGVRLYDDGSVLRPSSVQPAEIGEEELGCSSTTSKEPREERTQVPARELPSILSLSYYERARDYQVAQARASVGGTEAAVISEELPAVMEADSARALTETSLARTWAQRETLRLRLGPDRLPIEPGMALRPPGEPFDWVVVKVETDGLAAVVDLQPPYGSIDRVASDPGRVLSSPEVEIAPTTVAVAELPATESDSGDRPSLVVAAGSSSPRWRPVPLEVGQSGQVTRIVAAGRGTVLGTAMTILPDGQSALIDARSSVEVTLLNANHWLESRDDDSLASGENLAMIGDELIQFARATALGEGRYRLERLLRGRRGTEWAMGSHRAGENFILLDASTLAKLQVQRAAVGSMISVTPAGLADSGAEPVSRMVSGEALRPPSPVHLSAAFEDDGRLVASWVRRSRLGWAWLDEVDAPLGCAMERYRVDIDGDAASLSLETDDPELILDAGQAASLGAGPVTITVRQVGDFAASRPTSIQIQGV